MRYCKRFDLGPFYLTLSNHALGEDDARRIERGERKKLWENFGVVEFQEEELK